MMKIKELDVKTLREQYKLCERLIDNGAFGSGELVNSWMRKRLNAGKNVIEVLNLKGYENPYFGTEDEKMNINIFFVLSDVERFADKTITIGEHEIKMIAKAESVFSDLVSTLESPLDTKEISETLKKYAEKDKTSAEVSVVGPTSKQIKKAKKQLQKDIKKLDKMNKSKSKKSIKEEAEVNNKKSKKLLIKIAGGTIAVGTLVGGVIGAVRGMKSCNEKDDKSNLNVEWKTDNENSSDKIPYINPAEERENESYTSSTEDRNFSDEKKETQTSSENGRDLSGLINTNPQENQAQTETETERTNAETEQTNGNDPFEDIFGNAEPEM